MAKKNVKKKPKIQRRQSDKPETLKERVYKKKPSLMGIKLEDLSRERKILITTLITSVALLSLASFTNNFGILANTILLSTFIVAIPQFILIYQKYRDLKEMEGKFPVFLRDVIESLRSGIPLHNAIKSVSDFDYGKLSPEIKKMANQLTWGIPLENALDQFAKRVKSSKRLFINIKIIKESYLSGGDVVSTLETVSENSSILEEAEKERRSMLNQYVILMYAISFIFIGIVVAINNLMIPIFEVSSMSSGQILGLSNPCDVCSGFMCIVCSLYRGTAFYIFSIDPSSIGAYYISLFFFMSIMQSVFSGLVAGQIGENSVKAGIKHSLIMLSVTVGTFYLLVYFGLLGV